MAQNRIGTAREECRLLIGEFRSDSSHEIHAAVELEEAIRCEPGANLGRGHSCSQKLLSVNDPMLPPGKFVDNPIGRTVVGLTWHSDNNPTKICGAPLVACVGRARRNRGPQREPRVSLDDWSTASG
jgi:hypothetical protein